MFDDVHYRPEFIDYHGEKNPQDEDEGKTISCEMEESSVSQNEFPNVNKVSAEERKQRGIFTS